MPVRSLEYVDVTMMTLCPRSSKHYAKLYMCISTPPSPGTKKSDTIAILSLRVDRTYRGILPCLLYRHDYMDKKRDNVRNMRAKSPFTYR